MALDESTNPEDNTTEAHGITVVSDQQFAQHLEGAVIDYVDSANGSGFQIRTPHQSDCGSDCSSGSCGS